MIRKYWNTIRFLKSKQIFYRLFYFFKKKLKQENNLLVLPSTVKPQLIKALNFLPNRQSYSAENEFLFLNIKHQFRDKIDWNFNEFGKLWTYNLCYFDFLLQEQLTKEQGLSLILDFKANYSQVKDGLESYPSSLRVMNCVKFICKHQLKDEALDQLIYSDVIRLSNNLEFHLLGNHLLENAFALLSGAIYFNDEVLFRKAEKLLLQELEEQILADGGHYELSPMYHQIISSRMLDSISLLGKYELVNASEIKNILLRKAEEMLAWLKAITFNSGDIPLLNDSARNIAHNSVEIMEYASKLSINIPETELNESGYRKRTGTNYEFVCDVGHIGPDYIPGHAHSDTFNFVLNYKNKALIVDTGISTYEKNDLRHSERVTSAHNTVMVNATEQSEIWGGFRVGRRAYVTMLEEDANKIRAEHNGYKQFGIMHQRSYSFLDGNIFIKDELSKACKAKAFIHFHPDVTVGQKENKILGDFGEIKVIGFDKVTLKKYNFAQEFNKQVEAMVVEIDFTKELKTEIYLA
ncbi:MAG: alginate lyase family protein [Flavobacteriales bacterium]|nr:alginate lyase family protein [Flavobacteriales bacterium]